MTYEDFSRALNEARKVTGDDAPYVMHFRISTQGYDACCCQPFPLSGKMRKLRRRESKASVGVAHNGILSLTSDGADNYSDTMKFITDYLVNIIHGLGYHKDRRTVRLIENLIAGSRFAILGSDGFCSRLGKGWVEDKSTGLWYSNNSYAQEFPVYYRTPKVSSSLYDDESYWDEYWSSWDSRGWLDRKLDNASEEISKEKDTLIDNRSTGIKSSSDKSESDKIDDVLDEVEYGTPPFNFKHGSCPHSLYDEDAYCSKEFCGDYHNCQYVKDCERASCMNAKKVYRYLKKKKPCTVVGAMK
jgi:hypothetical protein